MKKVIKKTTMKTAYKRGRPGIAPAVERFIADEVFKNMRQLPEHRLPIRVLAAEIQKQLGKQSGQVAILPQVSTIEKKIQKYNKEPTKLDGPWSISSLPEFPIAPEALPTVIELWLSKRDHLNCDLTIREAQWVGRLYAVAKNMPLHLLSLIVDMYANSERMAELLNIPVIPGKDHFTRETDLAIYETMTGKEIPQERANKILGYREMDPETLFDRMFPPLHGETPLADGTLGKLLTTRQFLREAGHRDNPRCP
jgi:hypothetical protein